MGICRSTPTPTLPRKRERERSAPVSSTSILRMHQPLAANSPFPLPLAGEGGARVSARRVGARFARHEINNQNSTGG